MLIDQFTRNVHRRCETSLKQRIDLALLFTWRQIARMKNSVATNLLLLDETFDSSMDGDGVENLIKILGTLEAGTNVFIISHREELVTRVTNVLTVIKESGFTSFSWDYSPAV